jgi:hypothetical protein
MPTITFSEIEERVVACHAAEADKNARKAVAMWSVQALSGALHEISAADRAQVLDVLRDEALALPMTT